MKIYIMGTSCSGKTTLGKRLAEKLRIEHLELDEYWWLPGWQERDKLDFRELLRTKLEEKESWIIDGNYRAVRDLFLMEADLIIWLNLSFHLLFWRSIRRTLGRIFSQESVCNGNRENWSSLLSLDSMPVWVMRTYRVRRQDGRELKKNDNRVIELKTQKQIEDFLRQYNNGCPKSGSK